MEPAEKRCRQEDVSEDPWDDNDDFLHSNLEDIDQIIASQALEPPTTVVSHQSTTIRPTLERNKFSSIITDQLSSKEVENNLLKTEVGACTVLTEYIVHFIYQLHSTNFFLSAKQTPPKPMH